MDPVTHTLIGANLGHAFFKRRAGAAAVPALMFSSNLPDIDAAVLLTGNPAAIAMRRSFGHSLFALPVLSLILALLLKRKYADQSVKTLFGLCLVGTGVHVFFDLVNSFGVLLLWPLSYWRPELAIIFIIDFALMAILAAPFLLNVLRWERVERACRVSCAAVAVYVLFCFAGRAVASYRMNLASADFQPEFSYVFPEPFGAHRWRGVARRGNDYRVYLIDNLFWKVELKKEITTKLDDPRVVQARATASAKWLEAFFKAPVWLAYGSREGWSEARVYDLRFRPLVYDRGLLFEWVFRIRPDGTIEPMGWAGKNGA